MCVFFFNDTATTEIYTLSLHDALPIWRGGRGPSRPHGDAAVHRLQRRRLLQPLDRDGQEQRRLEDAPRSEEHTSELQSRQYLVCRLLLEKKTTTSRLITHLPTYNTTCS